MSGNPFANDIVDDLDSGSSAMEERLLHEASFDALAFALSDLCGPPSLRGGGPSSIGDGEWAEDAGEAAPGARGRVILLRSPRAGYGKTHLLARLKSVLGESVVILRLRFAREQAIGWEALFGEVMDACAESPGSQPGLSLLEEMARRVFGGLTAELIRGGEIPTADSEAAIRGLTTNATKVLDFDDEDAEAVVWFAEAFDSLLPSYVREAMKRYGISHGQAMFWLRELFRYGRGAGEGVSNRSALVRRFLEPDIAGWPGGTRETGFKDRFRALGRLFAEWRPLVLIADHLDGFFGDEAKGKEVASLLMEAPLLVPRSGAILSVNADLWNSIFGEALPSAMQDRLTSALVVLEGIDIEGAHQLVDDRLKCFGIPDDVKFRFLPFLGLEAFFEERGGSLLSPRQVLRHAKGCWERFAAADYGFEKGEDQAPAPSSDETPAAVEGGEEGEAEAEAAAPKLPPLAPLASVEFISLSGPPGEEGQDEPSEILSSAAEVFTEKPKKAGDFREASLEEPEAGAEETPASTGSGGGKESDRAQGNAVAGEEAAGSEEPGVPDGEEPPPALASFRKLLKLITGDDNEGTSFGSAPSGDAVSSPSREEIPQSSLGDLVERRSQEERQSLPSYYDRLRQQAIDQAAGENLRLDSIHRVIEAVGNVFPVVIQSKVDLLPDVPGEMEALLSWAYDNHEILFGFKDPADRVYWDRLVADARALSGKLADRVSGAGGDEEEREVKVILFTPGWGDAASADWVDAVRRNSMRDRVFVDRVPLDPETAGALYAAADLLDEVESGTVRHDLAEVVALISRELDYFWRRLTRDWKNRP